DRRRIDTAAQERSQRHIASKANFYGFAQNAIQFLQQIIFGSRVRRKAWHIPILADRCRFSGRDEDMSGRQFLNTLEDRHRTGHVEKAQIRIKSDKVDIPGNLRVLENGFDLRSKQNSAAREKRVIQRLLAHAIAREDQLFAAAVPDGQSKHSAQPAYE